MQETETPVPSDEQLIGYVASLPKLYREIMQAFRNASPQRKYGEYLMDSTLHSYLKGTFAGSAAWESLPPSESMPSELPLTGLNDIQIWDALTQLVSAGFVQRQALHVLGKYHFPTSLSQMPPLGSLAYAPTPLGERLLVAMTGKHTPAASIPQLPQPPWPLN